MIQLRLETPEDYKRVEQLTYQAFLHADIPGRDYCDEHLLVHNLRNAPCFVPELDYVAETGGKIVGNIMFAKSDIEQPNGETTQVLTFGPLSVLPAFQNRGIGAQLVRHTLEKARGLGFRAVFIFGHPGYYPRFGFVNAKEFGVTTPEGENFDAFMGLPLYANALAGVSGRFILDPFYEIDRNELAEFNKTFFSLPQEE
ncbi:MAG: N-acetyltransferase [Oscillospiraceae bacterium]|jgi:predicted N-acetyltransferase YhbS|nr:N-acetyltransferase [Oscillospiraceae bacterium]